jgi:hypothetical protein
LYWLLHGHYAIANYGSCALYFVFPALTSATGFQTTVNDADPNVVLRPSVDDGLGGTLAGADALYNMSLFPVRKAAVESTLFLSSLPPWRQIQKDLPRLINDRLRYINEHRGLAFKHFLEFLAQKAILLPVNLTGAVAEMIFLPLDFSKPEAKLGTAVALFYGREYYRKYSDAWFYEGWEFWRNLAKRRWLTRDVRQAHYSTAFQVWLQGGSAALLHTFPYFVYLALSAQAALGWWFSPYYIAAASFLYALCVVYPGTFNHYLEDREQFHKLLHEKPEVRRLALEMIKALGLPETGETLETIRQHLSWMMHDNYKHSLQKQNGRFYLFRKERVASALVVCRSLLGGYFGYGFASRLTSFMDYRIALSLTIPFSALSFGKLLYNAELERIVWKQQLKTLPLPPTPHEDLSLDDLPEMEKSAAARPKIVVAAAVALNASGAIVGAMGTVGSLEKLIGNSEPEVMTLVTLFSVEQLVNTMLMHYEKIADTVNDVYESLPSRKNLYAHFFSCCSCGRCPRCRRRSRPAPTVRPEEEAPKKPWFGWGKG